MDIKPRDPRAARFPLASDSLPRGAGVNQDPVEMRSRVIGMLLPWVQSTEDLLTVAEWIVLGPEDGDDDA